MGTKNTTRPADIVRTWLARLQELRHELGTKPGPITAAHVDSLSDAFVFDLMSVTCDMVDPDVIALVMASVAPTWRPALKSEIEALRTLAHRQQAIWAQTLKTYAAEDQMLADARAALEAGGFAAAAEIAQALIRDPAIPPMSITQVNAWRDEQSAAINEFLKNGSLKNR
jgi:hypothetical protein